MAFLGVTLLNVGLLDNNHFYPKWKADKCEWLSSSGQSWLLAVRESDGRVKATAEIAEREVTQKAAERRRPWACALMELDRLAGVEF